MTTTKATMIEDTLQDAGFNELERNHYSVEYGKLANGLDKRVYIDFTENSVSIDAYNSKDRLVSTEKIVIKHISDLNRAIQHSV